MTDETTLFNDVKAHVIQLEQEYGDRNSMCDEIEKMFLLEWDDDKPSNPNVKLTISPQARNTAMGAIRLMTAADPVFSVPFDKNDEAGRVQSETVEKFADALWTMAGRIRHTPIHYDAVYSGILFGEMHIGITSTADLLDSVKGGSKASVLRAEKVASITPYLFEVYDPRTGFPEYDELGLSAYYRKTTMKSGIILDRWGQKALDIGLSDTNRFEDLIYCDYWDTQYHVVWVEGKGAPLFAGEHGLPVIPIVAQIIDGSMIHEGVSKHRQPFLYTLWKSGLWNRQNLELTVMYTLISVLGNSAQLVYSANDESREIVPDYSIPGGVINILRGESLQPLNKGVIDPSVMTGYDLANRLGEESTIYTQALGAPLQEAGAAYSTVALLNSAGRLPLTQSQRRGGFAIGKAVEVALTLLKDGGKAQKVVGKNGTILKLLAKDVPDNLIMDCKLDVKLPQDDRQNAMLVAQLAGGDNPFVSKRWARETLLGVGQSDDMENEIYQERMKKVFMDIKAQEEIAQAQMKQQAKAMQMQQAAQPQPPQGAPMPQEQMPPEMMQGAPPQDMGQQLPPELMAQMGGAPGNGLPAEPMAGPVDMATGQSPEQEMMA